MQLPGTYGLLACLYRIECATHECEYTSAIPLVPQSFFFSRWRRKRAGLEGRRRERGRGSDPEICMYGELGVGADKGTDGDEPTIGTRVAFLHWHVHVRTPYCTYRIPVSWSRPQTTATRENACRRERSPLTSMAQATKEAGKWTMRSEQQPASSSSSSSSSSSCPS